MAVRMIDIARDLGLSVVTISKVLRNREDISEKTRERVLQRVKELNYRPNFAARSLVTGRSSRIGLVVPDLMQPFFTEIAKALSSHLKKQNYYLIISSYDQDPEMEAREIELLKSLRLDALVVASCRPTPDLLEQIQQEGIRLVLIDRRFEGFSSNYVGVDDVAVGRLATEHLIASGRKRIAHIRGPRTSPGEHRLGGYVESLAKHNLPYRSELVVGVPPGDIDIRRSGASAMKILLQSKPKPDAVFCFSDTIAIGAIDAIYESGLKVPDDISVIGCGNLYYASSLKVPLSSIDQHSKEIGERTGKLLLSLLTKKTESKAKRIILTPELVVRESTTRPRRK